MSSTNDTAGSFPKVFDSTFRFYPGIYIWVIASRSKTPLSRMSVINEPSATALLGDKNRISLGLMAQVISVIAFAYQCVLGAPCEVGAT